MGQEEDHRRYLDAAHTMQSGVAQKMHIDPSETTPKSLRVGVNSAMCDQSALAKLLIDKGVITQDEYFAAVADAMQAEQALYEKYLSEHYGRKITLA